MPRNKQSDRDRLLGAYDKMYLDQPSMVQGPMNTPPKAAAKAAPPDQTFEAYSAEASRGAPDPERYRSAMYSAKFEGLPTPEEMALQTTDMPDQALADALQTMPADYVMDVMMARKDFSAPGGMGDEYLMGEYPALHAPAPEGTVANRRDQLDETYQRVAGKQAPRSVVVPGEDFVTPGEFLALSRRRYGGE